MPDVILQEKLRDFLEEDVGLGDITTGAVVPAGTVVRAQIIVKEPAVVAGILEAESLFQMLGVNFAGCVKDGDNVPAGTVIAEVQGEGRDILTAERTVLNILMRMSGIATETNRIVRRIRDAGLKVRIAATRKTAPGLRYFDKKAVIIGGGDPHRFRLDDAFLVKDNHLKVAGGIGEALKRIRSVASFSKMVEVEAKTKSQALEAAKLGADIVMLDNMAVREASDTVKALRALKRKVLIEVSGGVTGENIMEYAGLEPDVISLGSITHSVRAVDISLKVVEVKTRT